LTIHNIYNQAGTGTLQRLRDQLTTATTISMANGIPDDHIIVGDINIHHPIWGGPHAATEEEAEDFIQDMDEAGMELLTEPGTVTWQREEQESTIDLTLISRSLTERLIQCAVAEELEHGSDHLPIRTIIDITTAAAEQPRRRMGAPAAGLRAWIRMLPTGGFPIEHPPVNFGLFSLLQLLPI
jgi:exonuclease III